MIKSRISISLNGLVLIAPKFHVLQAEVSELEKSFRIIRINKKGISGNAEQPETLK